MKKIKVVWSKLVRQPMFWTFALLIVIYLPSALLAPAENDLVAIVTGIGIDESEEGVELTVLALLPINNQTFVDSYRVVSARAKNIGLASNKLESNLGKKLDMAHTYFIAFGEEICRNGIKKQIDALIKSSNIGDNAIVLGTNKTAKDLLNAAKELDSSSGEKLKDVLSNNRNTMSAVDINIDKFYRDYLNISKCSAMSIVKIVSEEDEGIEVNPQSSSSGSGGEESSGGSTGSGGGASSKPQKISNDGSAIILKDAKLALVIDSKQTAAINLINPSAQEGNFSINGYIDEYNHNLDVTFDVKHKFVSKKAEIDGGRAKIFYKIKIILDVLQVESEYEDPSELVPQETFDDERMRNMIETKLVSEFKKEYDLLKEHDLDWIEINNSLKRAGAKKYRQFIEALGENPNVLQNVDIEIDIIPIIK